MKSRAWQAAYQAAVRATARTTHDFAAAVADQTVGDEQDCGALERRVQELEDEVRTLRIRFGATNEAHTGDRPERGKGHE